MRLSELYENTGQEDLKFQMAWQNKQQSIPVADRNEVHRVARYHVQRGESPSDAISNAWDIIKAKKYNTEPKKQKVQMPKPELKKAKELGRVSKSGKKWGNQYYSDPAQAGGIKGAIAKASPKALARKAVDKVDKEVGDVFDIEKAFTKGKDKRSRR